MFQLNLSNSWNYLLSWQRERKRSEKENWLLFLLFYLSVELLKALTF